MSITKAFKAFAIIITVIAVHMIAIACIALWVGLLLHTWGDWLVFPFVLVVGGAAMCRPFTT